MACHHFRVPNQISQGATGLNRVPAALDEVANELGCGVGPMIVDVVVWQPDEHNACLSQANLERAVAADAAARLNAGLHFT